MITNLKCDNFELFTWTGDETFPGWVKKYSPRVSGEDLVLQTTALKFRLHKGDSIVLFPDSNIYVLAAEELPLWVTI